MILSEQHLLEIRLAMEELITVRNKMTLENWASVNSGGKYPVPYTVSEFEAIEYKFKSLREQLIALGEK